MWVANSWNFRGSSENLTKRNKKEEGSRINAGNQIIHGSMACALDEPMTPDLLVCPDGCGRIQEYMEIRGYQN